MPSVTWRTATGTDITADVPDGHTLMEAAVANSVPGILGDCGGSLACATCHVVVDDAWVSATGTPNCMEEEMLEMVEGERQPHSRLSCQIRAHKGLDGLVLHVPAI